MEDILSAPCRATGDTSVVSDQDEDINYNYPRSP